MCVNPTWVKPAMAALCDHMFSSWWIKHWDRVNWHFFSSWGVVGFSLETERLDIYIILSVACKWCKLWRCAIWIWRSACHVLKVCRKLGHSHKSVTVALLFLLGIGVFLVEIIHLHGFVNTTLFAPSGIWSSVLRSTLEVDWNIWVPFSKGCDVLWICLLTSKEIKLFHLLLIDIDHINIELAFVHVMEN